MSYPEIILFKARKRNRKDKWAPENFQQQFARQNFRCAICQCDSGRWCEDHDHTTGMKRGILCHNCNSSLGLLRENITTIERMVAYLKEYDLGVEKESHSSD